MKKTIYIMVLSLGVSLYFTSCLKENNVSDPVIKDVKIYMTNAQKKDSLVTVVPKGKQVKFVVYTKADMVSVWPGGIRTIMKKKNGLADSIDMFNHPVLVVSDSYADYGLVKAKGLNTTIQDQGWYVFYTYPDAGEFDMTVVAANHGYDGPDVRKVIHKVGKITVK